MQRINRKWWTLGCALLAALLAGCVAGGKSTYRGEQPGWYGITTGWNGWGSDVDGEVGHPVFVSGPLGKCLPSRSWSGRASVVSGSLPPGLTLNAAPSTVTGIPTERGHWIVRLRMSEIQCEGKYYKDFEQELRFHIKGTGRVFK